MLVYTVVLCPHLQYFIYREYRWVKGWTRAPLSPEKSQDTVYGIPSLEGMWQATPLTVQAQLTYSYVRDWRPVFNN
jgi:hypothetical protein